MPVASWVTASYGRSPPPKPKPKEAPHKEQLQAVEAEKEDLRKQLEELQNLRKMNQQSMMMQQPHQLGLQQQQQPMMMMQQQQPMMMTQQQPMMMMQQLQPMMMEQQKPMMMMEQQQPMMMEQQKSMIMMEQQQQQQMAQDQSAPPSRQQGSSTTEKSNSTAPLSKPATPATPEQMHANFLRRAIGVAQTGAEAGNAPFAAILVSAEGKVVAEQFQLSDTHKAELTLLLQVAQQLTPQQLWTHTLYTTIEPCAMCAGCCYWANVGTVVFGMSRKQLASLTAMAANTPTLGMPCREVFATGGKAVQVVGPVEDVVEEIAQLHKQFAASSVAC